MAIKVKIWNHLVVYKYLTNIPYFPEVLKTSLQSLKSLCIESSNHVPKSVSLREIKKQSTFSLDVLVD